MTEEIFKCPECDLTTTNKEKFNRHYPAGHKKKVYIKQTEQPEIFPYIEDEPRVEWWIHKDGIQYPACKINGALVCVSPNVYRCVEHCGLVVTTIKEVSK